MAKTKKPSKWKKPSLELIELFFQVMEGISGIEKRQMFGCSCYFFDGKLFTGLHEETWILRLNEQDRIEMFTKHDTTSFEPMKGRIMKEYILLPKEVLKTPEALVSWIQRSLAYVGSLPEKKLKKPKSKASF